MNTRARWILALATLGLAAASQAGEPIRFIRPKADEKPLRHNFAAEKIRSRESLSASSFQPTAGTAGTTRPMGGGTVVVNPKARAAALARKNWASSENARSSAGSGRAPVARASSDDAADAVRTGRGDGSLFSGPQLGLVPGGPASGQPTWDQRKSGGTPDNRAALRSLLGETSADAWRDVTSVGASAARNGPGLGSSGSLGGAGAWPAGPPPTGPDLGRDVGAGSALGARSGLEVPSGRDGGFGAPAASQAPEARRPVFDPSDRPLRSSFELPTRSR